MIEGAGLPAARQPNERLLALIREAGCSNAGLARRVNLRAAERGLDFRYDKTSVARWIRGQQPRGRAPEVIAEALGRKLGRPVTSEEIGMAGARPRGSAVGLRYAVTVAECVEEARELWRADAGRPDGLAEAASAAQVVPSALVEPSRDWLITHPDGPLERPGNPAAGRPAGARVGEADVAAVTATTEALIALDRRFGSGHVRPLLVHYLDGVVSGLLAGYYRDTVGRRLFGAAARLAELAGYMALDTGRPGLAQRSYIQALRLAQAAGDRGFGGYVLAAGMSHLAGEVGNPREAVQLACAAQEGARGQAPPRAEALFLAAQARGHAQLGEAEASRRAGARALAALDRSGDQGGDDPPWSARFDAAYLADELAHCHRDLGQGAAAVQRAAQALEGHPESRARRRAIGLLLMATGRLQQGELEGACRSAEQAGELLAGLRSGRGRAYFADFRQRLAPHQESRCVREFTERWRGDPVGAGHG